MKFISYLYGLKIKAFGTDEISIAKNTVGLRYVEQLKDEEQTIALGYLLKYLQLSLLDGKKSLEEAVIIVEQQMDKDGLESLFGKGEISASLARPRRQEIFACINRYRRLFF